MPFVRIISTSREQVKTLSAASREQRDFARVKKGQQIQRPRAAAEGRSGLGATLLGKIVYESQCPCIVLCMGD